ncbi:hypothetical protein [Streptomyces sp. UG1]|uniref:hypothetical protein n=1 Tax=Streptomyces sp. UG1 TaxID=3417652 RepID=UPI003CF5E953
MCGGAVVRWLVLVAMPVLALAHGFTGAATHLPHHPQEALAAMAHHSGDHSGDHPGTPTAAESSAGARVTGVAPFGDGHADTACPMTSHGGPHLPSPSATDSGTVQSDPHGALLSPCATAPSRSPAKPSLTALSVLRI